MTTTAIRSLLTLGLLAAPSAALAQNSLYLVTQRPAPYINLSGGTVQNVQFDSAITLPLGFTFNYFGEPFTHVSIGENGAIGLQAPCSARCEFDEFCNPSQVCERSFIPPPWNGVPTNNPPTRILAPFWDNLLNSGTNPVSEIRTNVLGVSPNREFVVEWRNIRHEGFGGGPGMSRWTMQARLYEASGNVRFHYGPFTAGPDAQNIAGVIGIQSPFGVEFIAGHTCSNPPGRCTSSNLASLANQIIEIGRPNQPELTGSVEALSGGNPGSTVQVRVIAQNLGLQPTPAGFSADVYLGLSSPIVPARDTNLGRVTFPVVRSGQTATATLTAVIPSVLAIGNYYVAAIIDSQAQINEATESNNLVESPNLMLVGADLYAVIDNLPSGQPGETGQVEGRIVNLSSRVPSIAWRVFLSEDSNPDPGDTILANGTTAVPAGGEANILANVTFPNRPVGFYQVLLVVDPNDVLAEVDESNNIGISQPFILGPELQPSGVEGPGRTGPGESVELVALIDSLGSSLPAVPFRVWLSTDENFSPATDALIGSSTTAVVAGQTARATFTANVPAALMPGEYFFILEVDAANSIAELDESNNVWIGFETIRLSGPDVAAQTLTSEDLAFRGRGFRVATTLENVGGQTVRNVFYSFHLSANQLITVTDPEIFRGGPITLAPGQSVQLVHTATIAANFTRGSYYLGIIADSESAVVEDQENNNIRRKLTQIVVRDPAPDFLTIEATAPDSAAAGEAVTLQRLIENAGNAAGTQPYAVRLVMEGSPASDAVIIGRGMITLAAGASGAGVDHFEIPATLPAGEYIVEYVMDPDNVVDELDERNNVLAVGRNLVVEAAQLEIVSKLLPVGGVGVPYEVTLVASGGLGPLTWSVESGALPAGLMLESNGRISGTPTADAQARFVVKVTDGRTEHTRDMLLLVAAGQIGLELLTRSVPAAYVGQPYEYPLVAVGGVPPYVWTFDGELPAGFTLTSSGTLNGIGTSAVGSRVITFRVEDARGDQLERPISFRVLDGAEGVRFGDGALPDGAVGEGYEATIAVTGGEPPYVFGLGTGELPPGLRLEDGTVRGTPERAGSYTIELRVNDARGNFDLALFVVTISASGELKFVTTGLPSGQVGTAYADESGQTVQLRVLTPTDASSVAFGLVSGMLPPGVELSTTGRLTGTPTAPGVYAFVAMVSDGQGRAARGAFGISIAAIPTEPEPEDEDEGCGCSTSGDGSGAPALVGLGLVIALGLSRRRGALLALMLAMIPLGAQAQRGPPDAGSSGADAGPGGGGLGRYFLSTRTEAYVERTGGTPLNFPGVDDSSVMESMPFPFRLFETDYTSISIGTNGYVAFVGDASSLGNNSFPNSDPFAPHGVIAAFWDDLYNPTASVHVEGTAPNRVYIIQWSNTQRCCGVGASLDFQIHLFEGAAGRIEIHYGGDDGPRMEQFDASIGFEDESGSRGYNLVPCTPGCTQQDFVGLTGTVLVALQDAGEDVFANGIEPQVTGIGRVYQGVPFPVRVSYASYHGQPIGPFVYRVHLMTRADRVPNNPIYTSAPITLSPYDSRVDSIDVTLPLTVSPGRYRLALEMDSGGQVTEPDELNNVAFGTAEVLVAARGPDFTVESVTPSARGVVAPGDMVTVNVGLQNAGNIDGTVGYRVVLSANRAPTVSDTELASGSLAIPLLRTVTATVQITLPANLRAGEYWLGAIVDPTDMVEELSEVNNIGVAGRSLIVRGGPLAVLTTALPPAYRGLEYSARLVADAVGDAHWTVSAGALPDGLSLTDNGEIIGRPTAEGSTTFTVQVAAGSDTATRELTLEVRAGGGPLVVVTRALLPAVVGEAYPPAAAGTPVETQQHILASGGMGPATFTVTDGALPEGLTLDADGYLHGTASRTGTFVFTVTANDGAGTADARLTLVVLDSGRLTLVPDALADAELDAPYRAQLVAVGVVDPTKVEYVLVEGSGSLPEGLALDTRGTITGTATKLGVYNFSVRVTEALDSRVLSDTASFELEVTAPSGFSIAPATLPDATVGQPYAVTLEARLGRAPFTWATLEARRLPRGLTAQVVTEMGVEKLRISGTPEEVPTDAQLGDRTGGIATFSVSVTDSAGRMAETALAIKVSAPAPAPVTPEDEGGCSCASSSTNAPLAEVAGTLALALALVIRRRRR